MSNFRAKFLGLAGLATVFAGVSYAQNVACTVAIGANPSLRAEGETELLADLVATCTNTAGPATGGTLFITSSLPITSKAFSVAGVGSNEATLQVTPAGGAATFFSGTVTGSQVSFTTGAASIPQTGGAGQPANVVLQVSNIRVNASGATNPQVTESGVFSFAVGATSSNASVLVGGTTAYNAGFVLTSLSATTLAPKSVNNYTACGGNVVGLVLSATNTSFIVNIGELVGGAFKTNGTAAAGGEGGSLVGTGAAGNGLNAAVGTASTATEVTLTLANVPATATVWVPQTLTATTGATTLTISNSTPPSSGPFSAPAQISFTPVSGTVTVTYTVNAIGSVGAQTFATPVVVAFPANSAAAQGAITVLTSYAPAAVITGPAAAIPTFAVSTATPVSASTISICATTLLFPYVTNATGFETGIAIANTTTDNLAVKPAGSSVSTPTNGTCTLNFYGNAASPTATVTPTLGAYTAAAPTVVPIYANILTSMVGSSGFSCYAIAQCNFLEAHGFAFIIDSQSAYNGPMGYLATVIPATRNENGADSTSLTVSINTTGLVIGGIAGAGGGVASGTISGTASGTVTPTVGQ